MCTNSLCVIIHLMKKKNLSHTLNYPAVVEPGKEGGFNVSFPAFPGCVTFGKTFEEARRKAGEILALWLEELAVHHESAPIATRYPMVDEITVNAPSSLTFVA